jgi:Ca2+-binding RTX toxin-like protein
MPIYKGDGNNNIIFGSQTDDTIYGYGGDDTLIGGGGDDTIVGGIGKDTMDGGSGDDVYYVDNVSDVVVEDANKGKDIIYSSVTYSLANWAGNVEELILTGSADIDGHGNDLDNGIAGNSGDNDLFGLNGNDTLKGFGGDDFLDGGSGSDIMVGGTGDDYFVVDSFFDDITEYTGEGIDTVSSSVTYTLDPNVEKLILTGSSKIDGYGNQLNNELTGNSADNYLFGGGGADIMKGGDGGDDYYLDNVNA